MIRTREDALATIRYREDLFARPHDATAEYVRSPPWLADQISHAQQKRLLPEAGTVLDLGCGNGYAALLFAAHGYDAYGIDVQETLVERARAAAQELGLADTAHFAAGNYVPRAMLASVKPLPHVIRSWSQDPYAALGKQLGEFNAFFVYPFPNQMESVFRLFCAHAKPGARLMAIGDEVDWGEAQPPVSLVHWGTQQYPQDLDDVLRLRRSYTVYEKPPTAKQRQ